MNGASAMGGSNGERLGRGVWEAIGEEICVFYVRDFISSVLDVECVKH